jgi:hypothetical protein
MPYAPGIQSDFSPLFAGISRLGQNIERFADERKRQKDTDKALLTLVKSNPEQFPNVDPEHLDSLSRADRISTITGMVRAKTMRDAADQLKSTLAFQEAQTKNIPLDNTRADAFLNLQRQAQQATADKQARDEAQAEILRKAASRFAQDVGNPGSDVRSPYLAGAPDAEGQLIDWALAKNPDAINNPNVVNFLHWRMANQGKGGTVGPGSFMEDPETGTRFLRQGNTVLPSGINPRKLEAQAKPILKPDGTPIAGYSVIQGPKGFTVIKTPEGTASITGLPGEPGFKGTPAQLEAFLKDQAAKAPPLPPAERSWFDRLFGGPAAAPGATNAAPSQTAPRTFGRSGQTPATGTAAPTVLPPAAPAQPNAAKPSKFNKGEVRRQNGRLYQWDGSTWNDIGGETKR